MTVMMKCFGSETGFVPVLCIYGYSFTIFIPIVIACTVPINVILYNLACSMDFISIWSIPFNKFYTGKLLERTS